MKRRLLVGGLVVVMLFAPAIRSEAGFRSGVKKVGHVLKLTGIGALYVAGGIAAIYVCAAACRD